MLTPALTPLGVVDQRIDASTEHRLSLCPGRSRARALREVGEYLIAGASAEPAWVFAQGLAAIAESILRNFPDNLFWDLDCLAAWLWGNGRPAAEIREDCERVVALHELFGAFTPLSFRYVHDFLYGFDWARWVARAPDERRGIGVYDPRFLDALLRRGEELLVAIQAGTDERYPPLCVGAARNAFGFSREPTEELALYRRLAEEGWIPVHAWDFAGESEWERPYDEARVTRAVGLGEASRPGHR